MKTLHIFKKPAFILLCILGITACEKTESDTEIINKEGFMSTTGNSNTLITENQSEAVTPIFHMSFGAEIGKEEATAKFQETIAEYHSTNNSQNRGPILTGPITKWYYRVVTITGDYEDANSYNTGTDGSVRISIDFLTDLGIITKNDLRLDNPGNDREEGTWDFYYFALDLPNPLDISWIEVESAALKLKGKDGWYIREVGIRGNENDNTAQNTALTSRPGLWLDSDCNNCWDTFYTNDSETTNKSGRYDF